MRITAIEFAGATEKAEALPSVFATVRRSGEYAEITFTTPRGDRKYIVAANADDDERHEAAADLQRTLDGCRGTNSDVYGYRNVLDYLLD